MFYRRNAPLPFPERYTGKMLMNFGSWDTGLLFFLNSFAGRSVAGNDVIIFTASYLPFMLVAFFAAALAFDRALSWRRRAAWLVLAFTAAIVARIGIGSPIRFFFPRPRPFLTYPVHQLIAEHAPSFPSGHSLFFFAFSTVAYGYDRRLGILCYFLTVLICAARVASGIHYPSDIAAGAVLGIICGLIANLLAKRYLKG